MRKMHRQAAELALNAGTDVDMESQRLPPAPAGAGGAKAA
jgi:hypothetical protein